MAAIGLNVIILGLKHLSKERLKHYVWKNTFKDHVSLFFFLEDESLIVELTDVYSIPVFQIHS